MNGYISIIKSGDGWKISAGNDVGDCCTFNADAELIEGLIDSINDASCELAPWPVYEESTR